MMPKQGNSVESCIIVEWKKKEGDPIAEGDVLCEAETDKSTIEVESTAEGTILKLLYGEGDDVPVMLPIAIVGKPGENIESLLGDAKKAEQPAPAEPATENKAETKAEAPKAPEPKAEAPKETASSYSGLASPRARNLAEKNGFDISLASATGPKGFKSHTSLILIARSNRRRHAGCEQMMLAACKPAILNDFEGELRITLF